MDLTPDQLNTLQNLGLTPLKITQTPLKVNLIPLFSISGLTLLSLGGLILLKNKDTSATIVSPSEQPTEQVDNVPTQVPKSIQHYLLASQQYFSQALDLQQSNTDSNRVISYLNESIIAASAAIKDYPTDYRGYEQRGRIYQSLLDSQPQLLAAAIGDYQQAQKLNSNSADLTRQLASLFAKKGDLQNTLNFLTATVSLEPTKAQNFYDLARLQQQAGLLPQALETYNHLLPLITDQNQKNLVEIEKDTLQKIVATNTFNTPPSPTPEIKPSITVEGNLLQANSGSGPIIASPQNSPNITLNNQTDSNSLSGTSTLLSGQKQNTIQNSLLKSTSQIYVTILSGGKNQTLEILSKSKDSFTVGFASPLSEDVTFKWWIVNP